MALADLENGTRNSDGISVALGILKQRFGELFQTGDALREQHAHTTTYIPAQLPDGVMFAERHAFAFRHGRSGGKLPAPGRQGGFRADTARGPRRCIS